MKSLKSFATILLVALTVATLEGTAQAQAAGDVKEFAGINSTNSSVRFDVKAQHSGATLTISAPDGRVFRKEFKGGASPEFFVTDEQGERLPDGHYSYELRLTPSLSSGLKASLKAARGKDDDPETARSTRKRLTPASLVQSGGFSIQNGSAIVPGAVEEQGLQSQGIHKSSEVPRLQTSSVSLVSKPRRHHLSPILVPDQVIPDDLIVQGSICAGLDCINNENFGFDTIRMKENNTRMQFDDTSTAAGFPTNNWQIRANSSASGGESFLGFVDQGNTGNSETGTVVFQVNAGAPANSVRVSNTGKVGLRTATPVLDLHINTSDTPAHRLEQNSAGGFSAQTWDIAGNEANFFVRDVTGGSRLPFRIRPGAPTSSLDISATGEVGIGTASPDYKLHVSDGTFNNMLGVVSADTGGPGVTLKNTGASGREFNIFSTGSTTDPGAGAFAVFDSTTGGSAGYRLVINSSGNVGIGTTAPTDKLSVNGGASKPGGGSWAVFSDQRLKTVKGFFNRGLEAVMQLQPLRYEYKADNALAIDSKGQHVGFRAQSLQDVIPEAVSTNDQGYLMVNNDPIIWTMLNAIKEQQQEIAKLKNEVKRLRAVTRSRK